MKLIADLHVHSRFSRATSKTLDFIALHRGALEKGIGLVGTGDFTHPGWMAEIEDQLVPAEDGLFKLRPELAGIAEEGLPGACDGEVRFVLQVEISNIYKKNDKTRKNHNLVFVPTLDAARGFTEKLTAIGNVASDGRPILGLDARDLLEITLTSDPLAFLVPAHIWTPWFSLFGSKSGFDRLEECFGDLASEIFAVETGLSSDPSMNWRVRDLDRMTIISNSDAHSAAKLGREANLLDIELGYEPLRNALEHGAGFLGTIEFFPEEGKYHMDGHRKCTLRLTPNETREHGGVCPACGGKLTVGVMSRVMDLAEPDRPEGFAPGDRVPFECMVPLSEVVSEVLGVGPGSKKVRGFVERILETLGPELHVLKDAPLEDIERVGGPPLKEAVRRIRTGEMNIDAGYDGEFGVIKVFSPKERDRLLGQTDFIALPGFGAKGKPRKKKPPPPSSEGKNSLPLFDKTPEPRDVESVNDDPLAGLNPDQLRAAETGTGPLLVVAGPGTGKTRTLVARIAHQLRSGAITPDQVLAVTFTNQARNELAERLKETVPGEKTGPMVTTFHGLGAYILQAGVNPASTGVSESQAGINTAFTGVSESQAGINTASAGASKGSECRAGVYPRPENGQNIHIIEDDERFEIGRGILGPKAKKREVEALLAEISLA